MVQKTDTEKILLNLAEQSTLLFDLAPDAVFLINAQATIVRCNKKVESFYGYSTEDLIGTRLTDIMAQESLNVFKKKFPKLNGLESQEGEIKVVKKDGTTIDIWRKAEPLSGPGNEFIGALIFDRNLLGRIDAKELLHVLKKLSDRLSGTLDLKDTLRTCVDEIISNSHRDSGGIYLVDQKSGDFNLLYSKGLGADFISVTSSFPADSPSAKLVMKGKSIFSDYSQLDVPMDDIRKTEGLHSVAVVPIQFQRKTIACLNLASHSLEVVSPTERILIECMATQIGSYIVRAREHDQRLAAESEKSKIEDQYRQSQKMEAVGRLAGGVAHDFNNILCAIIGNTQLALESISQGDPLRDLIEEISKAADQASGLTRQLLAFSRKQLIAPKVINLGKLIENMQSVLKRLIGEDIIIQFVQDKDLWRIKADQVQMEQILLNLAINAKDAMPQGGELIIEISNVVLDEEYSSCHANIFPGEYVMLTVSDTGNGMSAEVKEKVFEPFFTTKEMGRGSGLGLATVFGIVEQNNGKIQVYSEEKIGSSFKIYLPRVREKEQELIRPKIHDLQVGNETVMVVEDEEMVRKLAERLLKRLGYKVIVAKSCGDAILLAETEKGPIHLLLTDVIMPHMNGRELASRLVKLRPELKVVFTSGYTHNVIAHHGVLEDDVTFLAKPYSIETLAAAIRGVLDNSD